MQALRALVREPLVHFCLLGALVFLLGRGGEDEAAIEVTPAVREQLAADFEARAGRVPDEDELERLVEGWIDRELLYREAIALGLDRDDPVIVRRLVQKMEFVQQSGQALPEPTDAELEAFFAEHAERYAGAPRYDFVQVIVPAAGDPEGTTARGLLGRLRSGTEPEALGLKVGRSRRFTLDNAAGTFGPDIARALAEQPPGQWELVDGEAARTLLRVDTVAPGDPPPLSRVRNRVALDWKKARRAEAMQRHLDALRERYDVRRVE